jgi:hypothetical protein
MKASSESGLWAMRISRVFTADAADSVGTEGDALTAGYDPFKRKAVAERRRRESVF